ATGDWRLATGDWRLATGDWRLAAGDWRLATLRPCSLYRPEKLLQLPRHSARKRQQLSRPRMTKLERTRMQEIPSQRNRALRSLHLGWRAVHRIAHHGMSQSREVHPNLVRPPSINPDFEESELPECRVNAPLHPVMRDRLASTGASRGHAHPPHAVAADVAIDCS